MLSLQEEQRLVSSRQAKEQAEQQLQERAKAAADITCGVDQVRRPGPSRPVVSSVSYSAANNKKALLLWGPEHEMSQDLAVTTSMDLERCSWLKYAASFR